MRALCALLVVVGVSDATAQPADAPLSPAGGRLAVGGEVTATYGSEDPGFFNYATYAYDPLRNLRVVIDGAFRPMRRVELLGQLRTDNLSSARLAALYVRIRPWARRDVDLQAGRVPLVFGLAARNAYGSDTPLINRPLAYAYLLSIRRDSLPANRADLLRMRGRGWLSNFSLGNLAPDRGLPVVNTDTWDTGVQLRLAAGRLAWAGALTSGSLSSPRLDDDNGGRNLSTRATLRVAPGLTVGVSAARGAYLSRTLASTLEPSDRIDRYRQRAFGLDLDAAAGRWIARAELIGSWWDLPRLTDAPKRAYRATAAWADTRVRIMPGVDVGVRAEHLGFATIPNANQDTPWEAPVTRVEAGAAYVPLLHVRIKLDVQRNWRPLAGRVRQDTLLAAQIGVWF